MSDILVSLTTTGFLAESDVGEKQETGLWKANVPVCIAEIGLMMFNFDQDREKFEHSLAESAKQMAKKIAVYPEKRTIFIGEDPEKLETAMVDYTEENKENKFADAFFQRWAQTQHMVYQHHFIGTKSVLFSLVGIWLIDHWSYLEIKPKGTMYVMKEPYVRDNSKRN